MATQEQGDRAAVRAGERPDPAQRRPRDSVAPFDRVGVTRHQRRVGPSAWLRGYEADVAGRAPYDAPPWRDRPVAGLRALARRRSSLVAAAVRIGQRRAHRAAPTPARRRRPPTDAARDDRRPPTTGRRRPTGAPTSTDADRPTTDGRRRPTAGDARLAGDRRDRRRRRRGTLEVPVDYDDPDGPTFELFVARHLADRPGRTDRLAARQPGRARVRRQRLRRSTPTRSTARTLLERFDIVGWDPRGTGLSEPAIDCIDDYDAYFAGTDITPDDDAERQQIVDLAEELRRRVRGEERRHPPARRHERQRPRHGRDPPGARRGPDLATSGSATAASSARRGRRCSPTPCGPRCSTAPPIPTPISLEGSLAAGRRASRARSTRSCASAAPTRRARSTTTATPRARSTP